MDDLPLPIKQYLDMTKYADSYLRFMHLASQNDHFVNVSTITLICVLNYNRLDLKSFTETFNEEGVSIKVPKSSTDELEYSKRGKVKKTFFNQITLNYIDVSKKSIKLFSNGKLQITGVSCYFECHQIIEKVTRWINKSAQIAVYQVSDAYIGMLNINFSVKHLIDLPALNRVLNSFDNVMGVYNPETYPAINMKLQNTREYLPNNTKNTTSLFIFGTGNIVVTGNKSIDGAIHAYEFINKLFGDFPHLLKRPHPRKSNDKDTFIDGYSARQFISCIGN
jgi:TATA-box binding protein (TBP) (component of TFIID and TFIIIB)